MLNDRHSIIQIEHYQYESDRNNLNDDLLWPGMVCGSF